MLARNDPKVRASQQRIREVAAAPAAQATEEDKKKRAAEQLNQHAAVKAADVVVHTYSLTELASFLKTDLKTGLSAAEGRDKLARDGPNVLTPPPETPWYAKHPLPLALSTAFRYQMRHRYVKLLMQMIGGFQVMMIVGAVLCFIVGPLTKPVDFQTIYLGIVLIIVVVSTGVTRDV